MFSEEAERIGQGRLLDKNLAHVDPGKWAQDEVHRAEVWEFMERAAGGEESIALE
jgi:hypothetical protein